MGCTVIIKYCTWEPKKQERILLYSRETSALDTKKHATLHAGEQK